MDKVKDKIKELREAKCAYPQCKKKQMMTTSLPVITTLESGKIIDPLSGKNFSAQIGVPFCEEHLFYAMQGAFCIGIREGKHYLQGPFEIIETVKVVLKVEKMKEDLKKVKRKKKKK